MYRARKAALTLTTLLLLIVSLCQAAAAIELSPRASLYLDNYGASIYQGSSKGTVRVEFTVVATEHSDYVGVSELVIYNSTGSRAATITGTVANGLLREDCVGHLGSYTYQGEAGKSYYAILTMYAERDGGSDSRRFLTRTVEAPT